MSNQSFGEQKKAVNSMTTAAFVQEQCHSMMRQLVMDLRAEKNIDGALDLIAREAELPFSKVRRIYYKLTRNILAFERDRLRAAVSRIAEQQEARIEQRLDNIRALKDARRNLEGQIGLRI